MSGAEDAHGWAAFRRGLLEPSDTAIAAASATVLAMSVGFLTTLGPGWVTDGRVRWLATGPDDDYAFVTATILDQPPPPDVIVVGASGTREAFTSEADLEARLGVDVLELTSDAQTTVETFGLLSAVPVDGAVVVYGVGPHMLELPPEELKIAYDVPRLGFVSPVIDAEFERLGWPTPPRTGWPAIDHRHFYLLRLPYLPLNLLRGGVERQKHRYLGLPALPAEELEADWPSSLQKLRDHHPLHLRVLHRCVESVEARGGRVVLVFAPSWTDWFDDPAEAAYYELGDALLRDFAEEHGLPLWRFDEEARLTREDYRNPAHLNNLPAMERFTAAVVARVRPLLQRDG